jgi:hypothetical protein
MRYDFHTLKGVGRLPNLSLQSVLRQDLKSFDQASLQETAYVTHK